MVVADELHEFFSPSALVYATHMQTVPLFPKFFMFIRQTGRGSRQRLDNGRGNTPYSSNPGAKSSLLAYFAHWSLYLNSDRGILPSIGRMEVKADDRSDSYNRLWQAP
jgi:hypothetical protein